MNEVIIGICLFIITGLLAFIAKTFSDIKGDIRLFDKSIAGIEETLGLIQQDLKAIAKHDSLIAVLNNEVGNLKADVSFLYEKTRELERNEKPVIHRGQPR